MNFTKIVSFGDSWTAGHEIDPKLKSDPEIHVMHEKNKLYRESRTYTYYLSKLLGIPYENYGFTGFSNDGIVRTCIDYIIKDKTNRALILVGWSSPERKDFYLDNYGWITLRPDWDNSFRHNKFNPKMTEDLVNFHKLYSSYFWNEEEYASRFKQQNILLDTYLNSTNNKILFFDTFYSSIKYQNLMKKSFSSILSKNMIMDDNMHPNSIGHETWANYLYKKLKDE